MGQYWLIVNVDKRCSLSHGGGIKLMEILGDGTPQQLVPLLKVPQWKPFSISHGHIVAAKAKQTQSALAKLPQELINHIVSHLNDNSETICLALTCGYFFRLLVTVVHSALIRDAAPWAGDRLIFIGDYADGYPTDVITDEEIDEWKQEEGHETDASDDEHDDTGIRHNPLYFLADRRYGGSVEVFDPARHQEWIVQCREIDANKPLPELKRSTTTYGLNRDALLYCFHRAMGGTDRAVLDMALRLLRGSAKDREEEAVLRNLNTKEYVLESRFVRCRYGLGEVICSQTTWTEQSVVNELECKGPWRAHRFDIATLKDVQGAEWRDESESMYRVIKNSVGQFWGDFGYDSEFEDDLSDESGYM